MPLCGLTSTALRRPLPLSSLIHACLALILWISQRDITLRPSSPMTKGHMHTRTRQTQASRSMRTPACAYARCDPSGRTARAASPP